jgi:hypothetical protein
MDPVVPRTDLAPSKWMLAAASEAKFLHGQTTRMEGRAGYRYILTIISGASAASSGQK